MEDTLDVLHCNSCWLKEMELVSVLRTWSFEGAQTHVPLCQVAHLKGNLLTENLFG